MEFVIAEDDIVSQRFLESRLLEWGYRHVTVTSNGLEAWEVVRSGEGPVVAVVDWIMSEMDGVELCRKVRESNLLRPAYLILLTIRGSKADVVQGLEGGADDYITKPFDPAELRARIRVGCRVLELEANLRARLAELETALGRIRSLQGLLPICSYCKRIRDDRDYWHQVESYIAKHSEAEFSHAVCPDCLERIVAPQLAAIEPPKPGQKGTPSPGAQDAVPPNR
jgi:CheY-like chemotaxis protein